MSSQVIDPYKKQKEYVEGNDYALPYVSSHLQENSTKVDPELFKHVNCSYLSTPGRPPTLEALKQHAQSLAVLISNLAPAQAAGEIDNKNSGSADAQSFQPEEAFDWLNDLSAHYKSDDPDHHRPLNSLVNLVKSNSDTKGVEFHCALECNGGITRVEELQDGYKREIPRRPYQRHVNLLRHANECLEILDHEYSATGGVLSILPADYEPEAKEFEDIKKTFIGQWLIFTQRLVSRTHDLEIQMAQALDLLKDDAVVPMQHVSAHGPDGRSGRTVVYPQDRWVLANAGDDVLEYLHNAMDKKEYTMDGDSSYARAEGVSGEALTPVGEKERGIVTLDLNTRYYRLRGHGRGPVFVLPAYADRPGTVYTRELESRPTAVRMRAPEFPERVSNLQNQNETYKTERDTYYNENAELKQKLATAESQIDSHVKDAEQARRKLAAFTRSSNSDSHALDTELDMYLQKIKDAETRLNELEKQESSLQSIQQKLASNQYSWTEVGRMVPRDADGSVTDAALQAVMDILKKLNEENAELRERMVEHRREEIKSGPPPAAQSS
ncbi:hypothetical protein PG993_003399 [Apiospora rasikravindrae]|uniref:Uncharacterized protein n=1 Tax=Apiospora rasikravindrae TaxID=990691 RepID=A0ABR1TZG1_9PEZI